MPQEDMAHTSRSPSARSEPVSISRPSPSKPRLIPYVEIPVYRGGLASRGSAPASRASSVNLNGHGGLKRKESEVETVETPPAKRARKLRVPGPPITLAERAQSLAASPLKPVSRLSRSAPRSTGAPETQSHFKVPDLPTRVIRPQRRSSSLQEAPVYDFTDEERRSTSPRAEPRRTGSPIPVYDFTDEEVPNGEASHHQEGVESQLRDGYSTGGAPSVSQFTEMVEGEPEPIRAAQEESREAPRPRPSRTKTQPRDSEGKFSKPPTTRKTKVGGRVTPIVKRKPGRPRSDGSKSIAVVQGGGVESAVRTRKVRGGGSKKANRRPTIDSESDVGGDPSEDDDQPRGPTTRFRMPPAPLPVSRGPPGQVPQDVMAAYASHSALLQSRTDTGLPQLYAAFQTFWIPRRANYFVLMGGAGSGLPYSAITSQGGGPGSSTAVHLSNPSFFYWDPLPLVPGGIRCPANECQNLLQQAGLVKQPKRVYMEGNTAVSDDPYVGFWIVSARYKCQNCGVRGTANPKVYSTYVAWDQKVLEALPALVRAEFPAVEKRKNGKKAFFAAELALPAEHRMDPQFVSTMLPIQAQPPVRNPASSAAAPPNGPLEVPRDPGPSHSKGPLKVASIGQAENPGPSALPLPLSPPHVSARAQPPASWMGDSEELGDAARQVFTELLFVGESEPAADGEPGDPSAQAVAGTSQTIDPGDGPNGASGIPASAESLAVASQVAEPLPSGSSTTGHLVQSHAEELNSTTQEGPSAADVGRPAASSSNHPSGSSPAVAHQDQPHHDIPRRYYSGLDLPPLSPPPVQPLPFQTPSASPTPPVPSTSAAPVPIPSALAGMHPYYAQFKAPTPQVTAPPSIHFFTPFVPPGASAPGSALAPSVPSWPPTVVPPPLPQPGPSGSVVSSYSTLAGAVTPPQNANHPIPTLPVPVIGTFNAESHVVVQVKQRQGPQKCSKCLQLGCKGANGVQHCPNPCVGCKQVDCQRLHTLGGNLCLEEGQAVTVPAELVPLEPSPSNSNSADGSGAPEVAQADVDMHDAEGEPEHEPEGAVAFGMDDILV